MPELQPNVVVAGRFRLNHKLGQGGMGSVWHATHLGLDTPCAVKFIEGDLATLPDMQVRFEREAKAAAALRSPHVVHIIDHAVWDGMPYMVMELLEGEDLRSRLERRRVLSPKETVDILGQVCRALTRAHAASIVHRDLKPENIFLARDDDAEIAKVLDFGIAKASKMRLHDGGSTKTGTLLGSPYYMSPEQASGTKEVDHRSDLWSMAVIAYECLVGQLPWRADSMTDQILQIIMAPAPVPSLAMAGLPAGFDAWWARAVDREPANRFQTPKDFIDSLAQSLSLGGQLPASVLPPRMIVTPPSAPPPALSANAQTQALGATTEPRGVGSAVMRIPMKNSSLPLVLGIAACVVIGGGAAAFLVKGHAHAEADPGPIASAQTTKANGFAIPSPSSVPSAAPSTSSAAATTTPSATTTVVTTAIAIAPTAIGSHKPAPKASASTAPTATAPPKPDLGF